MGDELWKEGYGIKLKDKPEEPESASPTDAIPPGNGLWDSKNGHNIDKVALHGFTIAELIDLGALAANNEEKNVLPNNLEGDVHPAFAIDKWETRVPAHFKRKHMFPLGNDSDGRPRPGNYTANNLLVWNALLPCLRLASKFVENAHIFPWYAAFLHSDIHPVTHTTAEAKKLAIPLRKLRLRPESDLTSPNMEQATRERIAAISKNIRLGISDGKAVPTGTNSNLKIRYDGVAIPPWEDDRKSYRIYLAYQIIEPLLGAEIGPSTKLALQFHVALTLLHEFAHVLVFAKDGARDVKLYLDNERISEAGFSFEMNTFGGHPVLLFQNADTPDYNGGLRAGFLLEDWLGTAKGPQWTAPLSGSDADWTGRDWREARSIPISFLEELGQEDFWRCFVGKWGADALKIYPWTEGRLVQKSGNTLKTQIYSRPKQERAWLEAAQQVSYKNPGPLTPDDIIAVRIANRRISRGKDINKFVKTRRRLNEQKRKEQLEETPAPEVSQEEDAPNGTQQEGKTPAVVIAELGKETPWQMRAQHIKIQKDLLNNQSSLRAEDEERVQHFLKREDFGTPDYLEAQGELMKSNKKDCESFRKWIQTAVDDELLSGYEGLLEGYEEMKVLLGRVSRQSSEDREIQKTRKATNDECGALLRRARACRARGEHKKCCDYCKEVLSKDDIAHYLCAGAFLLYGLSTTDKELKVWYLSEAVRIYKLIEHFERKEGKEPSNSTRNKTQHAEQRLQEAKAELDAANAAAAKTSPPGPKIISTILPSTPPNPTGPKPADIPLGKKPRKPFTGFGNPPPSPSTPSRNLDPAPKGMSPLEVMRHRRTFKVINQARRNFFNGDIDLAERGYLQLLSFEETSAWQKARCNVFLASIETRDDRAERARTALNMYREFLKMYPEDQRCVVAVRDAKELLKRVLKEIGWEKGARMSGGLGYGHPGLGNGFVGSGLDAISEGEGESGSEGGDEKIKQAKKGKEQSSFVAGVVGKVARLLGLKRTREDDDDGVSDKGGKGRKAARFA